MRRKTKLLFVTTFSLLALTAQAQQSVSENGERTFVIADAITHTPLRDVIIYTDNNQSVKTNWQGEFILSSRKFNRITITHSKYYTRQMEAQDFRQDTIMLIPKIHTLSDVVVIGHQNRGALFTPITKEERALSRPMVGGPDILGLIVWAADKLLVDHHKMTRKERLKKALDNY